MEPKKPKRSPQNSTLTISIPARMKQRIFELAAEDHRTVSSWCAHQFRLIIARAGMPNLDGQTIKIVPRTSAQTEEDWQEEQRRRSKVAEEEDDSTPPDAPPSTAP